MSLLVINILYEINKYPKKASQEVRDDIPIINATFAFLVLAENYILLLSTRS